MNEIKCGNCIFCHELKEYDGVSWSRKSCCTLLPQMDIENRGYDAFALVVTKDSDGCEMHQERK